MFCCLYLIWCVVCTADGFSTCVLLSGVVLERDKTRKFVEMNEHHLSGLPVSILIRRS